MNYNIFNNALWQTNRFFWCSVLKNSPSRRGESLLVLQSINLRLSSVLSAETQWRSRKTSKIDSFAIIVNGLKLLTIIEMLSYFYFFYQAFLSGTPAINRTAGKRRGPSLFLFTTLTHSQTYKYIDIYLHLCIWHGYQVFFNRIIYCYSMRFTTIFDVCVAPGNTFALAVHFYVTSGSWFMSYFNLY